MSALLAPLAFTAFMTLALCGPAWLARRCKLMLTSANFYAIALVVLITGLMLIVDDQLGRPLDRMPRPASFFLVATISIASYGAAFWRQTPQERLAHKGRWWLSVVLGLLLLIPVWLFMGIVTECSMGNCL